MKLKSAVAISALQAAIKRLGITFAAETATAASAVTQLGISLAVKKLPITMAIELGHFLIEKDLFGIVDVYDGTGAVDEFMFDYFKTLTDNPSVAEDAVYAFNKVLADNPLVADLDVLHFYKNLADLATFSDVHATDFTKVLTEDVAATGDHAYAYVKKVKADLSTVADAEYRDFYKALYEAPSLVDAIDTVSFFKNTQDSAGFTDVETFAFAKFLFDTVGATDDIDGAASVLDDQEMEYFKTTTNIANVTDTFVRVVAFVREYTDSADLSDAAVWRVGKALADNTLFTDLRHKYFGKLLLDNPVVSDALAIQLALAPFTDSFSATDSKAILAGKPFTNLASLADTGSLRSQGYSDFSYFAEDFVGASRTF